MRGVLERVQNEPFDVGADISVPFGIADRLRINQAQIDALEADCDWFNAGTAGFQELRPVRRERAAASSTRATCRRAERDVLDAAERAGHQPARDRLPEPAFDLLFILACTANPGTGTSGSLGALALAFLASFAAGDLRLGGGLVLGNASSTGDPPSLG